MKSGFKMVEISELSPYLVIGTIATIVDWLTFGFCIHTLSLHYQLAVILAFAAGSVTHYSANKFFTFKRHTKGLPHHIPIYLTVVLISLLGNMLVMAILVKWFLWPEMLSRIITTGSMLFPNYLLHKHFSFNKKLFI